MSSAFPPPARDFGEWRRAKTEGGAIADHVTFCPGLFLNADPALGAGGRWRSPPGRLLELDVTTAGPGNWLALHLVLEAADLSGAAWLGFVCRSAGEDTAGAATGNPAGDEVMIRPCLRSGTGDGFVDHFFDRHLLAVPEVLNHVDALYLPAAPSVPETAPWRELVLFLPRQDFRWHLHDLRPFLA